MVIRVFKKKVLHTHFPISVNSFVCKIILKIFLKHLNTFMKSYNLLSNFQSGFQTRDTSFNPLIEIYHKTIWYLDCGRVVKIVFCDALKNDKIQDKKLLLYTWTFWIKLSTNILDRKVSSKLSINNGVKWRFVKC